MAISPLTYGQASSGVQDPFQVADLHTRRLKPSAFPELPQAVMTELQRRGCTIPQLPGARRSNVIKGQFAKPGQTDWAVLCSIRRISAILVFWNGSASNVSEIAKGKDIGRLQTGAGDQIDYSWGIAPVAK